MADYYARVENGVITHYNVRRGSPHNGIGFSNISRDSDYLAHGYLPILGDKPVSLSMVHKIDGVESRTNTQRVSGPRYVVNGNVVDREYSVEGLTGEELHEICFKFIREIRNKRLLDTDVYALSDRIMSSEMTTYRQALRDFPSTVTDVTIIDFPDKPEELL